MARYFYFITAWTFSCVVSLQAGGDTTAKTDRLTQRALPSENTSYQPKDYSYLIGMPGFSDQLLNMHFQLYQGYVKNTNLLITALRDLAKQEKIQGYEYGALKHRFSWEFDGMRLHELYFENLGGNGLSDRTSPLYQQLVKDFGSFDQWKSDFIATGMMRGIGWVVLYRDPQSGRLMNIWINEHDVGHIAGGNPLFIMDVFEHAYMPQYGLDKGQYIQAFFSNIKWDVVNKRYTDLSK